MSEQKKRQRRLVRYHELKTRYGIDWSRTHLRRQELAGRWPKRVFVGANTMGWWDVDIDDHLEALSQSGAA